jgi:hypothetical protein
MTTASNRVEWCLPPPAAPMAAMMVAPMTAPVDLLNRCVSGGHVGELAEGNARSRSGLGAASSDDAGESAGSDGERDQFCHIGSFLFSVRYLREQREDTAHIRILPA